jgi:hypothetical protein
MSGKNRFVQLSVCNICSDDVDSDSINGKNIKGLPEPSQLGKINFSSFHDTYLGRGSAEVGGINLRVYLLCMNRR